MNDDMQTLAYWQSLAEQGDAAACYNVGVLLQQQANYQEAIAVYEKAIKLNPALVEAYNNIGGIYKANDELDKALSYYLTALKIKPDSADLNNNVGVVLKDQQLFKEAAHFFNQSLRVAPLNATTYYNLGLLYEGQKKLVEASGYYQKAFELDPTLVVAYWSFQMTAIQALCLKEKDSSIAIDKVKKLLSWAKDNNIDGQTVVGHSIPFYLTYQQSNNREFLSCCGDMCVSLMQSLQKDVVTIKDSHQKIRLGFVSDHFHNHSVWHAVVKGWYKHIDREKFEIVSFCLDKVKDADYVLAKQQSDYFFEGIESVVAWRDLMLAQKIDVLFFPAIGTNPTIHQLACLRMAPVQVTSWGHPETSGFPTIDYYLSADDFEPPHAQDNYRETLIRLPALGSCYEPLQMEPAQFNLSEFGLTNDTHLFIAPGKSFKYASEYDTVFPEIAARVNNATIIFFISKPDGLAEELRTRITTVFAEKNMDVNKHVIFMPLLERAGFHALMKVAHVYLDTIGFSGFNTAMQGIECGLPMVTLEGRFMRGRFGSAILRRLGLHELIASSPQEYIEKAITLANDDVYRESIKHRINTMAPTLYSDVGVVSALEEFILSVVKR